MSDLIRVVDLEVWANIGVSDEERAQRQRLLVTLDLRVKSIVLAAASDDVSLTVNYFTIAQRVKALASEQPRKLLETLAEEIAEDLLETFPLKKIELEIKKFILPDAQHVSVKIKRAKK